MYSPHTCRRSGGKQPPRQKRLGPRACCLQMFLRRTPATSPPNTGLLVPCTHCTSGPHFFSPRHTSSAERTTALSRTLKAGVRLGWPTVPRCFPRFCLNNNNQPPGPDQAARSPIVECPAPDPQNFCLWPGPGWGGETGPVLAWLPRAPEAGSRKRGHGKNSGDTNLGPT